jgi:hypothetical protein
MSQNLYLIDHKDNLLYILEGGWSTLDSLRTSKSIMRLRSHQGRYKATHKHCLTVAMELEMDLVSGQEIYEEQENIFIVHLGMKDDTFSSDQCDTSRNILLDTEPSTQLAASFVKTCAMIPTKHSDLFQDPSGIPPSSKADFWIVTDPLAKAPHGQPYRQTVAEKAETERQIEK